MKGAKIKINDLIAEQSGMESSGQRFILMEEPLSESISSFYGRLKDLMVNKGEEVRGMGRFGYLFKERNKERKLSL